MSAGLMYPDVLGYITNDVRHTIGVVQVAVTVHPFAIRAGQNFEVLVLLQNASDTEVDVRLKLSLPQVDKANQTGEFIAKSSRIGIDLKPGEVGYAVLPAACLPRTALGAGYEVQVEIQQKPKGRPHRVRPQSGGPPLDPAKIAPAHREQVEELRRLRFSSEGRRGLRGGVLAAMFNIMPGGPSQVKELQPRWEPLWRVGEDADDAILLARYREQLQTQLLPRLRRETLFEPFLTETKQRFKKAGFPLEEAEAYVITKLLILLLEYADAGQTGHPPIHAGFFDLASVLEVESPSQTLDAPLWVHGFLRLMTKDERVTLAPNRVITALLYWELLEDAMRYGFRVVAAATGEDLGTAKEQDEYISRLLANLRDDEVHDIRANQVYMPLVLAGIVICGRVVLQHEQLHDTLVSIYYTLLNRMKDASEQDTEVFQTGKQVLDRMLEKFDGRNW